MNYRYFLGFLSYLTRGSFSACAMMLRHPLKPFYIDGKTGSAIGPFNSDEEVRRAIEKREVDFLLQIFDETSGEKERFEKTLRERKTHQWRGWYYRRPEASIEPYVGAITEILNLSSGDRERFERTLRVSNGLRL